MSLLKSIFGGIVSGVSCAARLHRQDEKANIVMFERGSHVFFTNGGLPYYIKQVIKNNIALLVR